MTRRHEKPTPEQLLQENEDLRARLDEAEETLRAIREGEVDAVIVSGSKGDRVFSLSETENLHRLMVETMNEAGVAISPDGLVLFCNERACALLRRRQEQLLGHFLREFVAEHDADRLARLLEVAETGVTDDRVLFLAADGTAVPMHLWASRLARGDGPMICLVGTDLSQLEASRDLIDQLQEQQRQLQSEVTVRREAEDELRRNREWLRVTLTSIGDAVLVSDTEGRVTFLNPVASSLTGWTEASAIGEPVDRVCHIINERTRQPADDFITAILREKRTLALGNHTALVAKDGREIPIEDSAAPILDANGQVVGVVLVFHDVTEKRRAREALHVAERHLRLAVEGADVGIWISDPDSDLFEPSERAKELLGYAPHVQIGRREVLARVHPEDRERVTRAVELAGRLGEPFATEYRIVLPSGVVRWLSSRARLFAEGKARRLHGIMYDITPRKHAEEEMRRRAEEVRKLMDITPAAILVSEDPFCAQIRGNRAARQLFEAAEEENLAATADTGRRYFHNGRELAPEELPMQSAVAAGREVLDSALDVVLPSGKRIAIFGHATPLRDAEGNMRGCIGAFTDISELKRIQDDLKAARDSAERAKLDAENATRAKDRFLAVLSHELRTPLAPVLTGISLLEMEPTASEQQREYLEVMRRNVELESRLIDDLLDLTRIAQGRVELNKAPVELATIVDRAVEVCRADIQARRLHFGIEWAVGPCAIEADAARLQQVFWNLLKNAVKFTPNGGCVGVRGRVERGQVVVEVNDSGIGIDPSELPHIFDAFAQADSAISRHFGGLGLGLAISKALLEMHGGTIEARSEGRGKGTTFSVRLPMAAPPQVAADARARSTQQRPDVRPRSLRILLVEDHGDTAVMTAKTLEIAGHEVQTAGDVATALQAIENTQFELLISDLGLPDRSGLELIRELRARGSALPAIALSGYGQLPDIERSRAAGFQVHLVKPVDPARLLDVVHAIARAISRE